MSAQGQAGRHTDRDARWTIKHGKAFYGYKLHGNVDALQAHPGAEDHTRKRQRRPAANCPTSCS
jgi:hypothetical protein